MRLRQKRKVYSVDYLDKKGRGVKYMKFDTQPIPANNTEQNGIQPMATGSETGEKAISLVKSDMQTAVVKTENSLASARDKLKQEMVASGEAKRLSDTLSVTNPQSIIDFGKAISETMSQCADEILRRQDSNTLNQTSTMMSTLSKIMDKVDMKELDEAPKEPGFFQKIFSSAQSKLDQLMAKYNNIGNEIEKVCIELRTYESQIEQSNSDLDKLYENGVANYKELLKYTIAGECALEEIAAYKQSLQGADMSNPEVALQLNSIEQAEQLLQQRVQDLRMAETVALQSLPIIKSMEFGNLNLARKINSAFVVTIPVFKNAIAQAILAKRQAMQAKAMQALDEKTNEMLLRNAQNAANNMRLTSQLAGSSSIKVETIEQSWQTIMDGIKDTQAIQVELAKQRQQDKARIEEVNRKFLQQIQQR